MFRDFAVLAAALLLALGGTMGVTSTPAWSQSPGLTDGVQAPQVQSPTSMDQPAGQMGWNLSDLLWGLTRLQSSPRKLTAEQKETILPALDRVLKGAELVKTFDSRVEKILSTEQVDFIQHLAVTGALAGDPLDLPIVPPGEDPLVTYVVQLLEQKAR